MIPILDLKRQYQELKDQMEQAVLSVLESGAFILGPNVKQFEAEMATYLGCKDAIGVANGSDALYVALRALDLKPGDEVITTAFSYVATSESITRAGGTPVFVEADPVTFNIDLDAIEAKITPNTKVLLPVHLYGMAVDMDRLMAIAKKHNLFVVEDCAQAIGSEWKGKKVGTFGDLGCFSFFPTKNLGAYGDGGLVSTNSAELSEKVRMIRVHGSKDKYNHVVEGVNSRLDEIQAAVLRVKLPLIDRWNTQRAEIAARYNELLSGVEGVKTPVVTEGASHVYHQYTIVVENRDALQNALKEQGITSMVYYPIPLHMQGMHQNLGYRTGDFPVTEKLARQVLSLPVFPELTDEEISQVASAIKQIMQRSAQPV